MTSRTQVPVATQTDRRRWIALAIVMAAAFMDLVDVTIVNIAIPAIQEDIGATVSQIQWIVAGYALAFAVGLITGGRLGDIYGRKRLFLAGIAGFTIASALCGIAQSPELLVTARILQGAMAALMVPQVLAIIHATFPPHEKGKVFGLWGAIVGLGGISGPLIGALLTHWNLFGLEWRPIFLINLPVGILALILGAKYIEESRSPQALRLDLVGVIVGTVGLLMLLYPLTRGEETGWPTWGFVTMFASIPVFGALIAYERAKSRRDGSPLIELSLFRVKGFSAGVAVQLAFGVVTGVFFLVWTLYMQVGLGWSVLRAGLSGIPFSVATTIAAGISVQLLIPKLGRKVLQMGALLMGTGMALYGWTANHFGQEVTFWQMVPALLVIGFGMGLIVSPLINAILAEVPLAHAGSASGLIHTMLQVGQALGLALTSVFFFGVLSETSSGGRSPFVDAFENTAYWLAGILAVIAVLMTALPAAAAPPQVDGPPQGLPTETEPAEVKIPVPAGR
ncbi:MFS transporter [Micromonospora sp. NPDC047134]|uniref:MFS transporter n=1 Tax=Micromonospora sp. NPDC047134 TaxID=3154340 RepID=UPI0033F13715